MKIRKRLRSRPPVVFRNMEELRAYRGSADFVYLRGPAGGRFLRNRQPLEADNGGTIIFPTAAPR